MPPAVQSLDQILASLDPAYAPQRTLYQQQQALIPGQTAQARAGLDVAKGNAFRDVNNNANSKGLAFSGIPVGEQTRYVGEKYLPAVANLENDAQKQTFTLSQALAQLESDKRLKATDTQNDQQKTLDAYLESERDRQFKAQQAALDRAASGGGGGLTAGQMLAEQNRQAAQYKANVFKSGNYNFTGPNGAPISMYSYSQATGNSMLDLLRNSGSKYDKQAYNDAVYWLKKGGEDLALSNLKKKYSKLF